MTELEMGEEERGSFRNFLLNSTSGIVSYFSRHKVGSSITLIVLVVLSFMLRATIHPFVLAARKKSFLLILAVVLIGLWFWSRRKTPIAKVGISILVIAMTVSLLLWGRALHDYVALYYRYQTLDIRELKQLPVTGYERLQPRNSIFSLAHEAITEMEAPQLPDHMRVDGEYKWTMGIEPAHILPRLLYGGVREVVSVEGNNPVPNFSKREQVSFGVGEGLLLGRNTLTATIKRFGLIRYLTYEPVDVKFVKDDNGQWVQVVSLIRWTGIVFPRPEFGGVHIVRQEPQTFWSSVRRIVLGVGEWVPPDRISQHQFLVGQDTLSHQASRYIADSFRFQNGFLGPMPGNHVGDVRIPDMPDDMNPQPFTAYFEQVEDRPGMLYHYFALEPYDPDKQGLSVSLFIPADGSGPVYQYKHFENRETITGFSAISAKIMDTRKEYDWTRHRPVEHRPFIRDINGVRRFCSLTTVVTLKDKVGDTAGIAAQDDTGKARWFIAGTQPNIVITTLNHSIWVESYDSNKWADEVAAELKKRGLVIP
jgi:hypothetical protein